MLVPLISNCQHLSFLRLTFLLVVLFLAVNTLSLPFGASATSISDKERYRRMDEKLGFLEEKWRVVTGLHRRGLYSGRGHNVGVDRRSKPFARSEPFQEVSTSHPTGHCASRGTVAVVVGLATLAVAGFMI